MLLSHSSRELPDVANICRYTMRDFERDIDDYLEENDHDVTSGYPNNMHVTDHDSFGLDPFHYPTSYANNLAFDNFGNDNRNDGQGSLPLPDSHEQQGIFASSGLDGHMSSPNSQQGHEQHQLVMPSSFDSHSFHHTAQHDQVPFVHSIEHENTAPEEEDDEDEIPPKNEERHSDDDFEEDDEYVEADEEAKEEVDGQKKRDKRKPYSGTRSLIRWHSKTTISRAAHDILMHWQPARINLH